jgi:hypothetical protein
MHGCADDRVSSHMQQLQLAQCLHTSKHATLCSGSLLACAQAGGLQGAGGLAPLRAMLPPVHPLAVFLCSGSLLCS